MDTKSSLSEQSNNAASKYNEDVLEKGFSEYNHFFYWLLDKEFEIFKIFSTTIYDSQNTSIKNYLWLSIVIVGANISLLKYIVDEIPELTSQASCFLEVSSYCAAAGAALGLFSFLKGVRLFLSENKGKMPAFVPKPLNLLNEAYGSDDNNNIDKAMRKIMSQLEEGNCFLKEKTSKRARRIRFLNKFLLLSASLGGISTTILYFTSKIFVS